MRGLVKALIILVMLVYPVIVYCGFQYFEPRILAIAMVILFLLRLVFFDQFKNKILGLAVCIYFAVVIWSNQLVSLRFYPVVMSFGFLSIFTLSLFFPPPIIEKIARISQPNLPPEAIVYTRKVNIVWCVFFALNGIIALLTAVWASLEIWTLYNGFISYLLMGILFSGEYLIRQKVIKKNVND
jgi:uncharacterized membrane protein